PLPMVISYVSLAPIDTTIAGQLDDPVSAPIMSKPVAPGDPLGVLQRSRSGIEVVEVAHPRPQEDGQCLESHLDDDGLAAGVDAHVPHKGVRRECDETEGVRSRIGEL